LAGQSVVFEKLGSSIEDCDLLVNCSANEFNPIPLVQLDSGFDRFRSIDGTSDLDEDSLDSPTLEAALVLWDLGGQKADRPFWFDWSFGASGSQRQVQVRARRCRADWDL
jgi:hypothetical protein